MKRSCYKFALWFGLSFASANASFGQMCPIEASFDRQPTAYPTLQRLITDCLHSIAKADTEDQPGNLSSSNFDGSTWDDSEEVSTTNNTDGETQSSTGDYDQYGYDGSESGKNGYDYNGYGNNDSILNGYNSDRYNTSNYNTDGYNYDRYNDNRYEVSGGGDSTEEGTYAEPKTESASEGYYDEQDGYRGEAVEIAPSPDGEATDSYTDQDENGTQDESINRDRFVYEGYKSEEVSKSVEPLDDGCAAYDNKCREEAVQSNNATNDEEEAPYVVKFREEVAGPVSSENEENFNYEEGYGYDDNGVFQPAATDNASPSSQDEPAQADVVESYDLNDDLADTYTAPATGDHSRQMMLGVADLLGQLGVTLQNISRQLYTLASEDARIINR